MDDLLKRRGSCDRRWEDLDFDCLVNVFEKVGTESLLLFVPYVCKSWYRASLTPSCWQRLIFPAEIEKGTIIHPWSFQLSTSDDDDQSSSFDYFIRRFAREFNIEWSRFSIPKFMKLVIDRSEGKAQFLKMPGICSHYMNATREILEHIESNCKHFRGLHMSHAFVDVDLAKDIAKLVPKIKYLCLRRAKIGRSELIVLIKGCRDLEVLDVRDCVGFSERDKVIAQLASHIGKFMKGGSRRFGGRRVG